MIFRNLIVILILSVGLINVAMSSTESYSLSASNTTGLNIQINVGEKITIQISGSIHTNLKGNVSNCDIYTTANGQSNCIYNSTEADMLHNMPFMSLIGIINDKHSFVGNNFTNTFNTNGFLRLSINDWDLSDNVGNLTILVTRKEVQCSDTNEAILDST